MTDSYSQCQKLQILIEVTLNNVILPLRTLFSPYSSPPEIISLQVQDSENRTFEFIAQLISVICNTEEETANEILREFPKSEVCFQCLGINETIISGLIRIRGISFLELLDMQDRAVHETFEFYGETSEEIEHVLTGLSKIRTNIEYLESGKKFDDDTRVFITRLQTLPKEICFEPDLAVYPRNEELREKIMKANSKINYDNKQTRQLQDVTPPSPFNRTNPNSNLLNISQPQQNQNTTSTSAFPRQFFRLPFNLRRSKSHESDLCHRINPPNSIINNRSQMPGIFMNEKKKHLGVNLTNQRRGSYEIRIREQSEPFSIDDIPGQDVASQNSTFVLTKTGFYHKFEQDNRISNFVRGNVCSICKSRLNLKIQICIHCKIKVHKNCMLMTTNLPCKSLHLSSDKSPCLDHLGYGGRPGKNISKKLSSTTFPDSETNHLEFFGDPNGFNSPKSSSQQRKGSVATMNSILNNFQKHATSSLSNQSSSSPISPIVFGPGVVNTRYSDRPPQCENSFNFSKIPMSNSEDKGYDSIDKEGVQSISSESNIQQEISRKINQWNFPLDEIRFEDVIGHGSFGTVYRAKWHGMIAVKKFKVIPNDSDIDANILRAKPFEEEISNLHKCRHGNLVLFIGACLRPPNLAIITQLISGETLYTLLHQRKKILNVSRVVNIGSQIAKGLGYLHAKEIVHKDIKSKNIFLDNQGKVLIGDYGLFNLVKFREFNDSSNYINLPSNWIYYAAPEIIVSLSAHNGSTNQVIDLPYTKESDVFAFGTIWYELMTGEYPYKGKDAKFIFYLLGKGFKTSLNMSFPKDFKEFLIHCWCYDPERRPNFTSIVQSLDQLPKLHRSPSYPTKPSNNSTMNPSELLSSNPN